MKWVLAGTLLAAISAPALAQQGATQQDMDPSTVRKNPALTSLKVNEQPGAQLPLQAEFKDETGATVTFGSLFKGRPVVLLPIFYRCTGVCNLELQGVINALVKSPSVLPGKNIDVVALGINPKEGPDLAKGKKASTLEEYGKAETAKGWRFLTGDMKNIRSVTDPMGFRFTYDPTKDVVNHPSGIMILTPKGQVSAYMLAGTYDISTFQQDILRAGKEEIAPKTEEIFFGCVHVDPVSGKRSVMIQGVMRMFGVITLLVLVLGIFVLSRKPRLKLV